MSRWWTLALLLLPGGARSSSIVDEIAKRRDRAKEIQQAEHAKAEAEQARTAKPPPDELAFPQSAHADARGGAKNQWSKDPAEAKARLFVEEHWTDVGPEPGCGPHDATAPFRRPRDDAVGLPGACPNRGIVLRRDMGSLGVSSFQQVYGALAADALGPRFKYYDEWQMAASLLRPGLQYTPDAAEPLLREKNEKFAVVVKPHFQDELNPTPWNLTDAKAAGWVRELRQQVCPPGDDDGDRLAVLRIQGHFQHGSFYRRYREYIQKCALRAPRDLRQTHFKPVLFGGDRPLYQLNRSSSAHRAASQPVGQTPVAELVVYLRLGDKSEAGDTLLTFASGFYDAVLAARRRDHASCWIVTNSVGDPRAQRLAVRYHCAVQASPSYYSDWAALYLAPRTLVMAASTYVYWAALVGASTEVHYPAVGFFHDQHNVCMRRLKADSHFGQVRLPLRLHNDHLSDATTRDAQPGTATTVGGAGAKQVYYHDVYSRQFFLTAAELAAEAAALPCRAILDQHVCPDTAKPDNYRDSRYCYRRANATTEAAAAAARATAKRQGEKVVNWLRRESKK